MTGKAGRVAVLDLDNTLWGGVIGDDGLSGIRLGQNSAEGEAFVAFQRFVLELRARGVVLAVCSKNSDAVARLPFREHPDMLLHEDQIAVFQANWEDKATNIKAIGDALNLGLESLVLIDDNPAERERVRQQFALVKVPEIGEDPALFPSRLVASGLFEHLPLTADDIGRADAYGTEARRAEIRTRSGNYSEYLASLSMRMTIAPFDEVGLPRIAQLVNKSNQFNLRTQRYNEEALRAMMTDQGSLCWQVRLEDSFGSHGMIAVVIVRRDASDWFIDTWLQSCRVLERGVEAAIMNALSDVAGRQGAGRLVGEYLPTSRNELVADFFDRMGFTPIDGATGRYQLKLPEASPREVFIDVIFGGSA
jgi:FkbH-like protein